MSATSHPLPGSADTGDTDHTVGRVPADAIPKYTALYQLVATDRRAVGTVARLALGIVMFPHGAQKMLGWFGGHGFAGTYDYFTTAGGLPGVIAGAVIIAEFSASILLILGAFTRVAAFAIMAIMLGAVFLVHLPNGFWMNWTGQQAGEGFEYHILAIALSVIAIIVGGEAFSVDRALMKRRAAQGGSIGEPVTAG
jgi:putative oxidoreductase